MFLEDWQRTSMVKEYRAGDVTSAPWMAQRPNRAPDGLVEGRTALARYGIPR